MNRNTIGIIIVLVIVAGGWYLFSRDSTGMPAATGTNQMPVSDGTAPDMIVEPAPSGVTVAYTDQGFSPKSVTIEQGQTVTWVNQSSRDMWVASGAHPTHMLYDGTSLNEHCTLNAETPFDACRAQSPGASYSFTFNKEGTWKYHDHTNASQTGAVVVTAVEPL